MNENRRLLLKTLQMDNCCLGKLFYQDLDTMRLTFICYILERPYLDNATSISCIKAGEYFVKPVISPKFGATYYIESVIPGAVGLDEGTRTHILFHSGNIISHSKGCLLTGKSTGTLKGEIAVLNSKAAHKHFMKFLDGYDYRLTVERI